MGCKKFSGLKVSVNHSRFCDSSSSTSTTTEILVETDTNEVLNINNSSPTICRTKFKLKSQTTAITSHERETATFSKEERPISANCHPLPERSNQLVSHDPQRSSNSNDCDIPMEITKTEATPTLTHIIPKDPPLDVNVFSISQFGLQFAKWFFDALNSQNDFGAKHFWTDSYILLRFTLGGVKEEDRCIMGSGNVASYLSNYITSEGYFFQPYLTNIGVRTTEERHGLVRVDVSGIIHQHENCIGLFDFSFGLIRDPIFNNSWKIKTLSVAIQVKTNKMNSINYYT